MHAITLFTMCCKEAVHTGGFWARGGWMWAPERANAGWNVPSKLAGFHENAFCQNGSDQYKPAVLVRMHGVCVLCVFALFNLNWRVLCQ